MVDATKPTRVGIFAASSVVPEVEFADGIEHLRKHGFEPVIHAQVPKHHFSFAGNDAERAGAIYEYATDPTLPILWAARGGYGAGRLMPILEKLTKERGVPKQKKLLIGYSDVTVLHEFVRLRWGWSTLHAPMPAAASFPKLDPKEWKAIVDYVKTGTANPPWEHAALKWLNGKPPKTIQAELIGGNLSLVAATVGTPWSQLGRSKIIFLEDVDEAFYRLDRMMIQVEQAGIFDGAAAIVMGDFTNCKDESNTCLARAGSDERKPLRKVWQMDEAFEEIFTALGRRVGVPIGRGLPVGHGPNYAPLPLGAKYELSADGKLKMLDWSWKPEP